MARQEDACWRCGAQWASEETAQPWAVPDAGVGSEAVAAASALAVRG